MLRRLLGIQPNPTVYTYRSFGSPTQVVVIGRVQEWVPERNLDAHQSLFINARNFLNSYLARPYEGQSVTVSFGDKQSSGLTNQNGMFRITIPGPHHSPTDNEWSTASATLESTGQIETAHVLVEHRNNTIGIISDIDDTILVSDVSRKTKLLFNTVIQNAATRTLFAGTAKLYNSLVVGASGSDTNPVFYISSSHWNLYALLTLIFRKNSMPLGPMILKENRGLISAIRSVGNHTHKGRHIKKILQTYPTLPFVMIGDSSQHDAEIYTKIASKHPQRICAIYIRNVSSAPLDPESLVMHYQQQLADNPDTADIPFVITNSSEEILAHARILGLTK